MAMSIYSCPWRIDYTTRTKMSPVWRMTYSLASSCKKVCSGWLSVRWLQHFPPYPFYNVLVTIETSTHIPIPVPVFTCVMQWLYNCYGRGYHWQCLYVRYDKKVLTVMVNNSINQPNDQPSFVSSNNWTQKYHDTWCWRSRSWQRYK